MAVQNPIQIPNPTEGIIRSAALEDVVSQQNSTQLGVNVNYDRMGATTVRPGITIYNESPYLTKGPRSMGFWTTTNSTSVPQLIVDDDGIIKALISGTWTTLFNRTNLSKIGRFANFVNYTYFVDGHNADPIQSYDGTSWGTSNTGGLPTADYISSGLESRLWVGQSDTNTVYYTDQIPVGQTVTSPTNNFINFSPADGQSMTGMKLFMGSLLVFFQDSIYRIFGAYNQDAYPFFFVGTYSQESIIQGRDALYWHHPSGFYRMAANQQPQEISRRIIDVVRAIPRSQYEKITGWAEFDHIYWSCGSVTIGERSFKNLICRYTISTQVWTLYDYFGEADHDVAISSALVFDDGVNINSLVGVNDLSAINGYVGAANTGTTDNGMPIFYEEISRWINLTQLHIH